MNLEFSFEAIVYDTNSVGTKTIITKILHPGKRYFAKHKQGDKLPFGQGYFPVQGVEIGDKVRIDFSLGESEIPQVAPPIKWEGEIILKAPVEIKERQTRIAELANQLASEMEVQKKELKKHIAKSKRIA